MTLVNFYETLIVIYILMSWFPIREGSLIYDIGMVLQSLCEPYLSLFRRIIQERRDRTPGLPATLGQ